MSYLDHDFFARDTVTVARELIGARLIVGDCRARIVETEAYTTDAASHAVTRRHAASIMHHTYGHVYVYKIYGIHFCLNFTTEREGAGAVLIRAAQPLAGIQQMVRRRRLDDRRNLLRGPGRLCQALGIDLSQNGLPLGGPIKLKAASAPAVVVQGPRIGITRATQLEWRFYEPDNPYVTLSRLRPARTRIESRLD
ncbi:MAG: DNA-3-methyladenine glycosylase [Pirellulales bacterium]